MISVLRQYKFLLARLVKRDFIQKYKKTTLGILWSFLNPLCEFFVMMLIFKNMFGRNTPHYTTYIITGVMGFNFYHSSTTQGMGSLLYNGAIINKIKLPTWLFPLSKNISELFNFLITFSVVAVFMVIDNVAFTWKLVFLVYPILMMFFINLGISLILGSLYVFFKDISYFYQIFNRLLYYCSAIFWTIDRIPERLQPIFQLNPVFDFIDYVRIVIINGEIPGLDCHLFLLEYAAIFLLFGVIVYRCSRNKFIFYL